ncbi:MAG: excinuclease ABC subunit UvrC [Solirubrobacterales bacterium]
MFDFEYQLKILPDKPGVYIMKNSQGEIIYVGKAKVLKNRVRQYFQNSKNHPEKVRAMVSNISEFEYIVTSSEIEALILECNLIKKHRPRYNILLKDDKHYPFIKITINEEFPRIFVTRMLVKDGAKYFGPYTDVSAVYETIELIKKVFPIRNCKKAIKEDQEFTRPCLNYHIGLCKAPCGGLISKKEYLKIVEDVIELLQGKDKVLLKNLEKQMEEAAENLEFEKAAVFRDKINAINKITEKQSIITGKFENEDYIDIFSSENYSSAQVFFLRDGKITGREHFIMENTEGVLKGELVSNFIKAFYGGTAFVPKVINVRETGDRELLEQWLSMKRGSKVSINIPMKGTKSKTLELVTSNAKMTLEHFKLKLIKDKESHREALHEITELLNMDYDPDRIEAYDISNIQGVDSVGTMVVFEGGRPKNSDYRRFKIKTVKGANDYDSMREILTRRFKRGLMETEAIKENKMLLSGGKFSTFPDLILMDGGKGQVNIALEVLREFDIDIPVCGMVKDDKHKTRGLIYNNIELNMKQNSKAMKLITRIQDEVHRYAITYHRSLRNKKVLHSVLEEIPNIGETRRKELLKKFESIENIKNATYEELLDTPSIDTRAAESIQYYFKNS